MAKFISRFLDKLDSRWSLWEKLGLGGYVAASFGIPAWATATTAMFQQYAPLSWVAAGFIGILITALISCLIMWFRGLQIRLSIERRFYEGGDRINPLDVVFQNRRILISDLLPPIGFDVTGKTFINCEIIGPANIVLSGHGSMSGCGGAMVDAVLARENALIQNGTQFLNCNFQNCNLFKITFIIPEGGYEKFLAGGMNNWITPLPSPKA